MTWNCTLPESTVHPGLGHVFETGGLVQIHQTSDGRGTWSQSLFRVSEGQGRCGTRCLQHKWVCCPQQSTRQGIVPHTEHRTAQEVSPSLPTKTANIPLEHWASHCSERLSPPENPLFKVFEAMLSNIMQERKIVWSRSSDG
jgi:hypothetical protein